MKTKNNRCRRKKKTKKQRGGTTPTIQKSRVTTQKSKVNELVNKVINPNNPNKRRDTAELFKLMNNISNTINQKTSNNTVVQFIEKLLDVLEYIANKFPIMTYKQKQKKDDLYKFFNIMQKLEIQKVIESNDQLKQRYDSLDHKLRRQYGVYHLDVKLKAANNKQRMLNAKLIKHYNTGPTNNNIKRSINHARKLRENPKAYSAFINKNATQRNIPYTTRQQTARAMNKNSLRSSTSPTSSITSTSFNNLLYGHY